MKYEDYKKYDNVGDWYANERGFPIQAAWGISQLQKNRGLTFQKAFEYLVDNRILIFVDDEKGKK